MLNNLGLAVFTLSLSASAWADIPLACKLTGTNPRGLDVDQVVNIQIQGADSKSSIRVDGISSSQTTQEFRGGFMYYSVRKPHDLLLRFSIPRIVWWADANMFTVRVELQNSNQEKWDPSLGADVGLAAYNCTYGPSEKELR